MAQNPIVFLKEVKSELKKVSWPTKEEAVRLTAMVIFVSLAVGIFIGAIDYLFAKGMTLFIQK